MVRVGIIGVGYWGANLIRAFNDIEGASVQAVSETKLGRQQFVEKRYPHVQLVNDFREMLRDPAIDAVIVSTPVPTHYDVALEVLRAGKHVMVEKPLAYSTAQAEELNATAKALGLTLAVGHVYQFSPAVDWIASRIASGNVGTIYHMDSIRINLGPPQSEVDVVWDLAPHDISILLYLMQRAGLDHSLERLQVMGRKCNHGDLFDLVHVFLEFTCGLTAHVNVSWVTSNKMRLFQASAETGTILFDDMQPVEKVKIFSEAVDTRRGTDASSSGDLSYRPGDIFIPTLSRQEPLSIECRHFIECVESGNQPINGGDIGVAVVELLEMISRELESSLGH